MLKLHSSCKSFRFLNQLRIDGMSANLFVLSGNQNFQFVKEKLEIRRVLFTCANTLNGNGLGMSSDKPEKKNHNKNKTYRNFVNISRIEINFAFKLRVLSPQLATKYQKGSLLFLITSYMSSFAHSLQPSGRQKCERFNIAGLNLHRQTLPSPPDVDIVFNKTKKTGSPTVTTTKTSFDVFLGLGLWSALLDCGKKF